MPAAHGFDGRAWLPRGGTTAYGTVMPHQTPLAVLLDRARHRDPEWRALYDDFVAMLRRAGVGAQAPVVGDIFPGFALPDAAGHYRSLDGLLREGPLVLSFNRGGWCPYCAHELRQWSEALPALAAAGGHFAAVTPEVGGRAALMGRLLGLAPDADLLCDVDGGVALASGLAFYLGEHLQRRYRERGIDLAALYGSASGFLPVPATYVVDPGGVVRFAFADPDFRVRAEPATVIEAVRAFRAAGGG